MEPLCNNRNPPSCEIVDSDLFLSVCDMSSCCNDTLDAILNKTNRLMVERDALRLFPLKNKLNDTVSIIQTSIACEIKDKILLVRSMIKYGDFLVDYCLEDEAYYFYFQAFSISITIGFNCFVTKKERMLPHKAILQMAKLLKFGKMHCGQDADRAHTYLNALIIKYGSTEAISYIT